MLFYLKFISVGQDKERKGVIKEVNKEVPKVFRYRYILRSEYSIYVRPLGNMLYPVY